MSVNDPPSGPSASGKTLLALGAVLTILVVVGLWFFRPWIHALVYGATYRSPGILQWVLVGGALTAVAIAWNAVTGDANASDETGRQNHGQSLLNVLWHRTTDDMTVAQTLVFAVGVLVMLGGLLVGPAVGGIYANVAMADQVQGDVTDVDSLPATTADTPRILPYEVSYEYAQNSLQYPRHHLEGGDIAYINGTPHWSYALAPDGLFNSLFAAQQEGGVYVNMTTSGSDVTVEETTFEAGQGTIGWRNYEWQLLKDDYWAEYQDPMMVSQGGEQYIVVPYVEHSVDVRFTPLPQVYSLPAFGGVKIVHADGTIEDVAPDAVSDHAVLADQRVYPYALAKYKVNSMRYQHGALNTMFYHEDELELAPAPGEGNDQPFTVTTTDGIKYVAAAEPWGDASGIYQLWSFDGQSGEMKRLQVDVESAMLGPNRAVNYVRQENPTVDWDRMNPVEPIPVVRNDTLYWQVKIVPSDGAGVSYVAFVNADTSEVTTVDTDNAVRAFIAGSDDVPDQSGGTNESSGGTGDSLVITIERDDGSTERIEVEEGSSITIHQTDGNETATTRSRG